MNIKSRIERLEAEAEYKGYALIYVNDGETNDEAYRRYSPDDTQKKPKSVVYLSEEDRLL
jgi:hypothetical protein